MAEFERALIRQVATLAEQAVLGVKSVDKLPFLKGGTKGLLR